MTDKTTELLRKGLAERGIEWRSGLEGVTFAGDWCFVEYDDGKLAATCEPVLTPEQAIAATLGDEPKSMRVFDSMETALAIAEKEVEIEQLKRENAELCDENAELTHRRAELEAATLGGGTCTRVKSGTKPDGSPRYRCSNCKYGIGDKRWSYCPKCGRKVVKE